MSADEETPDRVVVVDDDPARRGLRDGLEAADIEVTAVETVAACLDAVDSGEVDAVVGEVDAGDASGLELLRRVREHHPLLPFVVYTDAGSESLAGEAFALGASDYVPKSDGPATVLARLRGTAGGERPEANGEFADRYSRLVENSPVPINLFDSDGTTIWGNDAVLDLLGLDSRDDLVGRSIFEFIDPDDRELAEAELEAVVENRVATGPTRMDLRREDGAVRHVLVSTAPGRFRGEAIGQAVAVDVTALHRTQEDLEAERRVVDNALDTLADVFFIVDPSGRMQRWNAAALETTGYSEEEFRELTVPDLIADEDVDRVLDAVETVLSERGATVEARVVTAGGELVPHEFRGNRLEDEDGNAIGVVGIARDLTDIRERERQLLVLEQLLRHNVRNNVNVILGYAESIGRGEVDQAAALEAIRLHGERLVEQADKEKRLVGLMTGSVDDAPVDVDDVVGNVVAEAWERHPDAVIEFDPSGGHLVRSAPGLPAAVEELVENAIGHSDRETPTVRVDVSEAPTGWRVRVADDGPGIPDVERAVLEPESTIDQLHHGSGVGLWLVHWAARLSGGSVRFEDDDPGGTVATIELPPSGDA